MNDLRTILYQLEDRQLDYVVERSRVNSDAEAYRNCSISKAAFYKLPAEKREELNDLAQQLKRESALRAVLILSDATEKAAQVKVAGLDNRKDNIKQAAATEILDRQLGKPMQRQETELSTKGDKPIFIVSHGVEDDSTEYPVNYIWTDNGIIRVEGA